MSPSKNPIARHDSGTSRLRVDPAERSPVTRGDSLGNQIADQVRQDVLMGRLIPGTPIVQQALCDQYGTSRIPVRDALAQLSAEGLIIVNEHGRAVVAPVTVEDIEDAFHVEAVAHSRAARRAAVSATEQDIEVLEGLNQAMIDARQADDIQRVASANWRFHGSINRLAGSAKLTAILRTASLHIPRQYLVALPEFVDRSSHDHEAILAAFHDHDGDAAERLTAAHVAQAGETLVAYLRTTGTLRADT